MFNDYRKFPIIQSDSIDNLIHNLNTDQLTLLITLTNSYTANGITSLIGIDNLEECVNTIYNYTRYEENLTLMDRILIIMIILVNLDEAVKLNNARFKELTFEYIKYLNKTMYKCLNNLDNDLLITKSNISLDMNVRGTNGKYLCEDRIKTLYGMNIIDIGIILDAILFTLAYNPTELLKHVDPLNIYKLIIFQNLSLGYRGISMSLEDYEIEIYDRFKNNDITEDEVFVHFITKESDNIILANILCKMNPNEFNINLYIKTIDRCIKYYDGTDEIDILILYTLREHATKYKVVIDILKYI